MNYGTMRGAAEHTDARVLIRLTVMQHQRKQQSHWNHKAEEGPFPLNLSYSADAQQRHDGAHTIESPNSHAQPPPPFLNGLVSYRWLKAHPL